MHSSEHLGSLSIRTKIKFWFVSLFMTLIAIMSSFFLFGLPLTNFQGYIAKERSEALQSLGLVANLRKWQINNWIEERQRDLSIFAARPDLLTEIQSFTETQNPNPLRSLLTSAQSTLHYPGNLLLAWADSGQVIASNGSAVDSVAKWPIFVQANNARIGVVGDFDQSNETVFFRFAHPLFTPNGQRLAVLILSLQPEQFFNLLFRNNNLCMWQSCKLYILNHSQETLFFVDHTAANGIAPTEAHLGLQIANLQAHGVEGVVSTTNGQGEPILAALRYLRISSETGWGIVVRINEEEFNQHIRQGTLLVGATSLLGILLVLIFATLLANQLTRHILFLSHIAKRLSGGDLTARSGLMSKDEVGLLGSTIDHLADSVQQSLHKSEERFRYLFHNSPDGILVVDKSSRFVIMANRTMCKMLGASMDEMETMRVEDIHPTADLPVILDHFERMARGEHQEANNIPVLRKDGSIFVADIAGGTIKLDDRECLVGFFRDITERKSMEAQLIHGQKLEALGTLAGGIAHDFNNILAIIVGNAELGLIEAEDISVILKDILAATQRGKSLVDQLLTFSRKSQINQKPLDPIPLFKEVLKFIRATIPSSIEIRESITPPIGMIASDPTQFHQVLINLCNNAAQALGEKGGLLELTMRMTSMTMREAEPLEISAGQYLVLAVRDNGPGIDPRIKDRIFEPFFTTKGPNKGTGLGLSVVHGVMKGCHGAIQCESAPGRGTLFRLYFPMLDTTIQPAPTLEQNVVVEHGKGRILLVDDEKVLLEVTGKMLDLLGYQIEAFTDPIKAVEHFTRCNYSAPPQGIPGGVAGWPG